MRINIWCKRYVFLLVLLFSFGVSYSKVLINLSIDDCANCSLVLSEIMAMKSIDTLKVVMPYKFLKDDKKIKSLYGFKGNGKVQMVYSDSVATYLGNLSYPNSASSIFVFNSNNTLIYKNLLKGLNLKDLKFYTIFSNSRKLRIEELDGVNMKKVKYSNGLLSIKDYFNNLYFYDLGKRNRGRILTDSLFIIEMYKAYYGSRFKRKFPVMQRAFNYQGRLKPEITSYDVLQNRKKSEVSVLYNIRDFDIIGKDTSLFINQLIYKYNLRTKEGEFCFKNTYQPLLKGRDMGIRKVFYHDGNVHLYFYNKVINESSKPTFLASLKFTSHKSMHLFTIDELHANITPQGYVDKVGRMAYRVASVSGNGFLFAHADSLYVIDKKDKILVPFEETLTRSNYKDLILLRHYFSEHDSTYAVYCLRRKPERKGVVHHLLQFDSNGKKLIDKSVEDYIFQLQTSEFIHPFQIIGISKSSNEILFVDL